MVGGGLTLMGMSKYFYIVIYLLLIFGLVFGCFNYVVG